MVGESHRPRKGSFDRIKSLSTGAKGEILSRSNHWIHDSVVQTVLNSPERLCIELNHRHDRVQNDVLLKTQPHIIKKTHAKYYIVIF